MERSELIERLVPLIPPPRAHQVRYHGILAPCASLRSRVVPPREFDLGLPAASGASGDAPKSPKGEAHAAASANSPAQTRPNDNLPREDRPPGSTPKRLRWAELLQRVFEIDALRCPRCGSTLRLIAAIEDPAIARRILECIGLPARAPPLSLAPSRDVSSAYPSQVEEAWDDLDQTPLDEDP
jgi:hypothetical protein